MVNGVQVPGPAPILCRTIDWSGVVAIMDTVACGGERLPGSAGPDALPLSQLGVWSTCAVGGVSRPPQAAMPVTEYLDVTRGKDEEVPRKYKRQVWQRGMVMKSEDAPKYYGFGRGRSK